MILRGRTRRSGLQGRSGKFRPIRRRCRTAPNRDGTHARLCRSTHIWSPPHAGSEVPGRRPLEVGDDEPPCDPRPVAILCSGCWELWAMSTNRWRWRPPASAPPRFDQRLAAVYLLLVVPAVVGAALDWPEALTFALIVPGLLGHMRLSIGSARAQGVDARGERPPPGLLILLSSVLGVGAATATPAPFGVLVLVLVLIFVVDPVWRLAWSRGAPTTT